MQLTPIFTCVLLFFSTFLTAQNNTYQALLINDTLKKNANAVVRLHNLELQIRAYNKVDVKDTRVITVFNSFGQNKVDAFIHYDNNVTIKTLEAKIYNAFGLEIKKIKKRDFKDVSAVSGSTLYSDSRVKYLDYTPTTYPYTVVFTKEYQSSFTVGLPRWYPIDNYNTSVERTSFKIVNLSN